MPIKKKSSCEFPGGSPGQRTKIPKPHGVAKKKVPDNCNHKIMVYHPNFRDVKISGAGGEQGMKYQINSAPLLGKYQVPLCKGTEQISKVGLEERRWRHLSLSEVDEVLGQTLTKPVDSALLCSCGLCHNYGSHLEGQRAVNCLGQTCHDCGQSNMYQTQQSHIHLRKSTNK